MKAVLVDYLLEMKVCDLIVVGAGPAGLTAAIYAGRYMLDTLVFGELIGGLASEAYKICNFPTYESITGIELASKMKKHVENLGIQIKAERVTDIKKKENIFEVKTDREIYQSKKIILATGTKKRKLNLEKEDKFLGRGLSYCATCDAGFFKDKIVGVIGGSNAALTAALLLSEFATKVYIIYRQGKFFRAEPAWVDLVKKNKKIELIFNANIVELLGKDKLESIKLDNDKKLKLDGLFITMGSVPNTELAEKFGVKLENKYVKTDKEQKTNIHGVFAAGDITNNPLKQIITACGEGAIAATSAYKEIMEETK